MNNGGWGCLNVVMRLGAGWLLAAWWPIALADSVPPPTATSIGQPCLHLLLVGDSTMASYKDPPADRPTLTGWGQVFDERFIDCVEVLNDALSGRSSKSFIREGAWGKALERKADYVFIQFGHNDMPGKGDRSTDPRGDYRDYLRQYIDEARAAGMQPILVTPVARRDFSEGRAVTTLGPYVEAMQAVAREKKAPLVDLHAASFAMFDRLGDEASADLSPSADDRTHFSRKGAETIATLVAAAIPEAVPELKKYLKPPASADQSRQ